MSIDASAEVLQISKMSIADTRSFFGDSFPAKIRSTGSSVWSDTTFTFQYSRSAPSITGYNLASNFFADNSSEFADYDILVYQCTALDLDNHDLLIDLPMYFPDYAIGAFAVTNRLDGWSWSGITQSENVIATYPDNWYTDFDAIAAREPSSVYGVFLYDPSGSTMFWRLYPYQCDSNGTSFRLLSVQSVCAFYDDGYKLQLMIFCPHIGSAPQHSEPVVTTAPVTTAPSGTGDINVNVDVDMTETNGLLGSILDALSSLGSSIVNGIKNIFLPDQEDIVNWKQTIVNILNETFGGIPELEQQLKNAVSSIFSATARETVRFEGIKVPAAAGEPEAVIVPAQDVPLKPSGFGDLFSWAETFINIVATIAVANTCFNQIKRIVVGEVVVDAD